MKFANLLRLCDKREEDGEIHLLMQKKTSFLHEGKQLLLDKHCYSFLRHSGLNLDGKRMRHRNRGITGMIKKV